jgi:hypothetical protein
MGQRAGAPQALLLPFIVVTLLTAWVCAGSWGRGWLLYRDFVTVPDPVLGPQSLGLAGSAPRAVPLDAVTALLDPAVPSGLQQQLMLAGSLLLAGWGVAFLLRRRGMAAMVVGGACAVWNPFVAERLLVGQPPTLLAYSMTPWIVAAVAAPVPARRRLLLVVAAALPAALTPWGGVTAALVAIGSSLWLPARRSTLWLGAVAGASVAWCLPWVVPALWGPGVVADPDGAAAFAVRDDSAVGVVGSVLTLGGIWAQGAWPASRGEVVPLVASTLLVVAAAAGLAGLARAGRRRSAILLGAAYAVPVGLVLALATSPGLSVFAALQAVPGVALVRDTHRLLGFAALAVAVGAGLAAHRVVRWLDTISLPRGRGDGRAPAAIATAAVLSSVVVLTVPDLPASVGSAYRPVEYPVSWAEVVAAVEDAPGEGSVLLLPWQPFRAVPWAGGTPFLDPLPRALTRPAVSSFDLLVQRDGHDIVVSGGDPAAGSAWAAGHLDPDTLRRAGIDVVVEWKGTPGLLPAEHPGLRRVLQTAEFDVWVAGAG